METTHSNVGASSCERWWNCPGSVRLIGTLPPQEPSEYAKEGTKAHAIAAYALQNHQDAYSAAEFMINSDRFKGVVDSADFEMCDYIQTYLDVIREDLEKYPGSKLDVEIQFTLPQIHADARGTCDATIGVFLTKLIVYDFKYGKGTIVDVEGNKQALYYALGALEGGDYETIEIVIVQPRAIHRDGPVRRWTLAKPDLLAFGRELKARISATEGSSAALVCGEYCQKYFCPALAVCPAVKQRVGEVAKGVFDEPVRELPKPESLSPLALKKLLDTIPIIDAYVKAVEDFALNTLNNGGKIDGYKLVAKKSNRQWKDVEAVEKKWPKIVVEMVKKIKSPAQVETALAQIMKKKEAVALVEDFCYKPDTGNTIASIEDPREEARPKLESTFQDESIFS
jgi:Protein of unknown function (DUF2800)